MILALLFEHDFTIQDVYTIFIKRMEKYITGDQEKLLNDNDILRETDITLDTHNF